MIERISSWVALAGFGALALGCASEDPVNLGNDATVKTGEKLSDFAATWDGYIEAFDLTSGSDRIRVTLDPEGHGTITFGDGTMPAPPTDPNVAWPPSETVIEDPLSAAGAFGREPLYLEQVAEGFPFAATGAEVTDRRLRFTYNQAEPYRPWCELQVPYASGSDAYSCVPSRSGGATSDGQGGQECYFDDANGAQVPVDCGWLSLCVSPVCSCDVQGCSDAVQNFVFDGALDDGGDTLVGTTEILRERVTVRLTRQ